MPRVAVIKGNAYEATIKALELTNFKSLVKRKSRIVIKPNLVPVNIHHGNLNIDVIRAVLDNLQSIWC